MDIEKSIETIEAGYEFLLAYAAQGRPASDETDGQKKKKKRRKKKKKRGKEKKTR